MIKQFLIGIWNALRRDVHAEELQEWRDAADAETARILADEPRATISLPEDWTPDEVLDFKRKWDEVATGNPNALPVPVFISKFFPLEPAE